MRGVWFSREYQDSCFMPDVHSVKMLNLYSSKAPARQQCRQRKARKHLFAFGIIFYKSTLLLIQLRNFWLTKNLYYSAVYLTFSNNSNQSISIFFATIKPFNLYEMMKFISNSSKYWFFVAFFFFFDV